MAVTKKKKEIVSTPIFKFNFKIIKPIKIANKNKIELHCTEENHNKFYYINLLPEGIYKYNIVHVIITYGRIGAEPQQKKHTFHDLEMAYNFMNKKKNEKLKKGYKIKA